MQLPNWFKIAWWGLLLAIFSFLTYIRFNDIENGLYKPIDIFIVIVLICLVITPIFHEIEFFGVKVKQDIADLKEQFTSFKNDIRNDISVRAQINPQI